MNIRKVFCKALKQLLVFGIFFILVENSFGQEVPVLEWAKSIGGTGGDYEGSAVVDSAGNVYTTGYFAGTADFDPGVGVFNLTSAGFNDLFILKLDASGNFVWAKSIGGATTDDEAIAISQDDSGNVYVAGFYSATIDFDPGPGVSSLSSASGSRDIFILKLTKDGDFVWAKSVGGSSSDNPSGIVVSGSGDVFTTGTYQGTGDFDPGAGTSNLTSLGAYEVFVVKLDAGGNFVWAKSVTNGAGGRGQPTSIALDGSGNVLTLGIVMDINDFDPGTGVYNLTAPGGHFSAFISKLDNNGNFVWANLLAGNLDLRGYGVITDPLNNVYTTGYFTGTADFDPGTGVFNLNAGSQSPFVSKLDATGNFVWAVTWGGGSGGAAGTSIAVDALGNVYSTGYFFGFKDFDPGTGVYFLGASGVYDNYISKLDSNGSLVWATSIPASDGYEGSITLDDAGNLYVSGSFVSTPDFDPGACAFNIITKGAYDVFIQKLSIGSKTTITSFDPLSGPVGTVVTITGTSFSTTPTNNVVKFFNNKTATVTASTATSITTTVPAGATTGKISLTLNCATIQSTADFVVGSLPAPTIASFTPTSGPVGTSVTITGTNFSTTPANNTVNFNGTTAVVTASTSTSITTTAPVGATTGKISVTVAGNTATSVTNFTITVPPSISINIQPSDNTGCEGTSLTFNTSATGTTNIAYQWQFSSDASPAAFSDISDGTGYSGTATNALAVNTAGLFGAGNYRCKISGDLATTVYSSAAHLIIDPLPSAPVVNSASGCSPSAFTINASGGVAGNYRWYVLPAGGVPLTGATSSSFTTPIISADTTFYVSVVTGTCESVRTPAIVTITGPCSVATISIATQPLTTQIGGLITLDLVPLITTDNLDAASIHITEPPSSGAPADIANGILTINYAGISFSGTEKIKIQACDLGANCADQEFSIDVAGEIIIYNAVSPGGANPTFVIRNIELLPETKSNSVSIHDRWQNLVWRGTDYDNTSVVFKGVSENGNDLPTGTYFYKIEFNSPKKAQTGFISLKR